MNLIKASSIALLIYFSAFVPVIACEMHNKEPQSKVQEKHQTKHTVTKAIYETTLVQSAKAAETSTITVDAVWAKPNYGPNGAVYLKLKNNGKEERKLESATSPLSELIELHQHLHEDGVMKMRPIKTPLIINPGETVEFKPGGLHIMLFKMKEKKKTGESYPLTLKFADGEHLDVTVTVKE